jgi:hypothetical protein
MIVVWPGDLARVLGNETLVICGPGRGGTSIISYILLSLGYYLGEGLEANHEDRDILAAIGLPSRMEAIVADRNLRYQRWGFKIPIAVHHVDWLASALRNPVFLVVFRNPVAIAKTVLKRDPTFTGAGPRNLVTALEHGFRKMELGTQVVMTRAPSILIDVDAARGTPEQLVRDLVSLFAPNTSDEVVEAIADEIGAAGYKSLIR